MTAVDGIGASFFFPTNSSAVMKAAPPESFGISSGMLRTFANIGMVFSFAVAILIASFHFPQRGDPGLQAGEDTPHHLPGKVKRHYTSQRCSACGEVDRDSRESQAVFRCTACGFAGNADVNAARNIAAGHAVTARGGDGIARPVNREPQLLLPSA